jgi:glycosyltransferase involved in cell wall biosynthesis
VAALDQCRGDDALRARLVEAGARQAARFSWERCGDGLERLYHDAAGARG